MDSRTSESLNLSDHQLSQALWKAAREGCIHATASEIFIGLGFLAPTACGSLRNLNETALQRSLDAIGRNSEPPMRAFVAAPFDPEMEISSLTPSIQLIANDHGHSLTILDGIAPDGVSLRDFFCELLESVEAPDLNYRSVSEVVEAPNGEGYGVMVEKALKQMKQRGVKKVVLSRSLRLDFNESIDPASILERMREREPFCTIYAFPLPDGSRVVGASPELVLSKHGNKLESHPLAGTLALGPKVDPSSLTKSQKDLWEHRLVVDGIAKGLSERLTDIEVPSSPSLVVLRTVAHLGTRITAKTSEMAPQQGILEILSSVHPSAAISGIPLRESVTLLQELESFDRGFFGGAFGWVDQIGDGEFILGIRGAWLVDDSVRLYAGAGIVEGSSPEGEREETLAKLQSILNALVPDPEGFLGL